MGRTRFAELRGLHWLHWTVLLGSLMLTIGASWTTSLLDREKLEQRFEQEATQSAELVLERMQKYEGGLWAGVGLIQTLGPDRPLTRQDWIHFSTSIDLVGKYPGINGIGVIHHTTTPSIPEYLARLGPEYPELEHFRIHPSVEAEHHFPISYIEPFADNHRAVGLDMAFERHRFEGAMRAMETGRAQITGPIVLVQDAERTPGFLFFAPFYSSVEPGRNLDTFQGMVYAPFLVKDLMAGVLQREKRSVALRITDDDVVLYDEHLEGHADYDPEPLFEMPIHLDMYGRNWSFDIRSTLAFRQQANMAQSIVILIGGFLIDGLLLSVFLLLARSRRKAVRYADQMTAELRKAMRRVERSNRDLMATNHDLEQFTFIASHDLQSPLRHVYSYAQLLGGELDGKLNSKQQGYLEGLMRAASRMNELILDVLRYTRVGRDLSLGCVDCGRAVSEVLEELEVFIGETGAEVRVDPMPTIQGNVDGLTMLLRNLIYNALRFRREGVPPSVHVACKRAGGSWRFSVSDNGIGIEAPYRDQVFRIFQTLHNKEKYGGTGIGLALCKKIVDAHHGRIHIEGNPDGGTTVVFELPATADDHAVEPAGVDTLTH